LQRYKLEITKVLRKYHDLDKMYKTQVWATLMIKGTKVVFQSDIDLKEMKDKLKFEKM